MKNAGVTKMQPEGDPTGVDRKEKTVRTGPADGERPVRSHGPSCGPSAGLPLFEGLSETESPVARCGRDRDNGPRTGAVQPVARSPKGCCGTAPGPASAGQPGEAVDWERLLRQLAGLGESTTEAARDSHHVPLFPHHRPPLLIDLVPDLVTILDREYRIVLINRAMARKLGIAAEQAVGLHCYDLVHKASSPPAFCPHARLLADGQEQTVELHDDGLGGDFLVTVSPLRDSAGGIIGSVHIARDITELKRAEKGRRALETQLRHAQKMEAIGQLAGGVAHDFNNILTAIIGYGNLFLMKMKADDPLRIYAEQILSASEKAAQLTQNLLAFSRKQILNTRPLNLNEIVIKIERLLSRLIGEDIELVVKTATQPLGILADSGQIEQVLMNLVTNARDAMPGGGRLTIWTETAVLGREFVKMQGSAKPGRYAVLCVEDSGTGMDEATRERVFEPFFTTKPKGKGTGLGLAMVYGIIKQHDGFVNVNTKPGEGATFRIYLPLMSREAPWADSSDGEGRPVGGSETILLVEDDGEVRRTTSDLLKEFGYTVIEAVDGEDALKVFRERSSDIHLLITDVVMPRKSGKDLCDAARIIKPGLKVLFASGYAADVLGQKGMAGMQFDLVRKPTPPQELMKRIREILDAPPR